MLKISGLGSVFSRAQQIMNHNPSSQIYKDIEHLEASIKELDGYLVQPLKPETLSGLQAVKDKTMEALKLAKNEVLGLTRAHDVGVATTAGATGLVAGGALATGAGLGAHYLEDHKQAMTLWTQGFVKKCEDLGIDGSLWLETAMEDLITNGITKKSAPWGKLFGGILGGTALALGARGYRRAAVNEYQDASKANTEAQGLIAKRKAEVDKMNQPLKIYNNVDEQVAARHRLAPIPGLIPRGPENAAPMPVTSSTKQDITIRHVLPTPGSQAEQQPITGAPGFKMPGPLTLGAK